MNSATFNDAFQKDWYVFSRQYFAKMFEGFSIIFWNKKYQTADLYEFPQNYFYKVTESF